MELAAAERDRTRLLAEEMICLPDAVRPFEKSGQTGPAHREACRAGGSPKPARNWTDQRP